MLRFHLNPVARAVACCTLVALGAPATTHAQTPSASGQAPNDDASETVVVTGSVVERRIADAPYAISVLGAADLRNAGPMINLSEAMARVPGMVVANRNNYAQDLQISSRGFGARAGFGVRGVRLYTDGIPASMPDGQGQVSHFDLANAQRVEVLRGPFSVLYGNSSGGVIAAVSAPVRERAAQVALDVGSFGLRQLRAGAGLPIAEGLDARVGVSAMQVDGFRPQSEARKETAHARLNWQRGNDRVVLSLNHLNQPADDPLGLTRAQLEADARQTAPQATQFDTRKKLDQQQLGASWRHGYGSGVLAESTLTAYAGKRSVTQWLAIAAGTQANARHGGGVIDFDRSFNGVDARVRWRLMDDKLDVVTGVAVETQSDDRQGFLNYTGTQAQPTYGAIGALRREETNRARNQDVYAQAEYGFSPALMGSAGLRVGRVKLSARDAFLSNGDDSGSRGFSYTNPVLGLRWLAAPGWNVHASLARGFESPTLGELAYRADGTGGFNLALDPQKSKQLEVGTKWRSTDGALSTEAVLFRIDVDNEISVASNAGGRQSFRNVGRTRRQGGEFGFALRVAPQWTARAALTLLDATYRDPFLTCTAIPCTAPTVPVSAGKRIAGTQRGLAFGEIVWKPWAQGDFAIEARSASALTANDTNTEGAPRYTVWALRGTYGWALSKDLSLEALARIDNATNKSYAGSVIVNDANGRFYEPGAPRNFLLSLRLQQKF
jgi:iron complex outermembrane recepter protein